VLDDAEMSTQDAPFSSEAAAATGIPRAPEASAVRAEPAAASLPPDDAGRPSDAAAAAATRLRRKRRRVGGPDTKRTGYWLFYDELVRARATPVVRAVVARPSKRPLLSTTAERWTRPPTGRHRGRWSRGDGTRFRLCSGWSTRSGPAS
jgi:hypothetical protein